MRAHRLLLPLAVVFAVVAVPLPGGAAESDVEWMEVFSPDGAITRTAVPRAFESRAAPAEVRAAVVPIQQTGAPEQRFDLVFVGDGYTAAETAAYHAHVVDKWDELSAVEPFKSYKQYFNVWQVDVVSNESGVDNDPALGSARDTALDMGFWCQGRDLQTERLLCVNQTKATQFAALAPGADQVIALGNTAKYGGAGGGVATAAGGNAQAGQIAVHELGHSIGGLADEYDYPYEAYSGAEPTEVNVTKDPTGAKWSAYLGQPSPDGGAVGAFAGAKYHRTGLYRPTSDSIMRTLGREFNLVGRDAMVDAFRARVPELP
ncbi:M64 family metallopeptidase [Saccharothrix longispora]|uniref:M64 family metallopeptidase n=1 Tax=Saccharothrix longispora TaxID=33920 RepID=UPI0028FD5B08|nr:M64 family metallopeptidase [Saccharothrix longispora]MDU0288536.1 M64 family metallopeptidase [Saccharothrix longispora]